MLGSLIYRADDLKSLDEKMIRFHQPFEKTLLGF